MHSWFHYLREGLSRTQSKDRVGSPTEKRHTDANLKILHPFFVRHWYNGLTGVGLVVLSSLLAYPQPLLTRYMIDDVILAHRLDGLWLCLLLIGGIKVLAVATEIFQRFYFTRFEQTVMLDMQSDLFERLLRFPKSFFDETEIGYLMSRIQQDIQGVRLFFSQTLLYTISSALRFVGGVFFLAYLDWRLTLVVLVFLPILVSALGYFSGKLRVLAHEQLEQSANVSHNLQEALASTTLIKTFASEKRTIGRLVSEWKTYQKIILEQSTVGAFANMLISALPSLANALTLAVGAYWVIQGDWTFGSLMAFQAYLGYVYGPTMSLASMSLQMQNALVSLARISALYQVIPEDNAYTGKQVDRLMGEVEFRGVDFAYDGYEKVLENLSFHVKSGEHIAVVGPSGVGKTTLVSLILCLYRPIKGDIFFDGLPASTYELTSLRRRMGYVSQVPRLLSGTIMENLCYGNPEASEVQVVSATRSAGIHDFILNLPSGYQSFVGENGVNLSEGQKQRLSIARALIKDPDILILDEPTSSLDGFTEKSFIEALKEVTNGKTVFLIAHRMSTVKNVNRLLLLQEKRIVGIGTHSELLESNKYYCALVNDQQVLTSD